MTSDKPTDEQILDALREGYLLSHFGGDEEAVVAQATYVHALCHLRWGHLVEEEE